MCSLVLTVMFQPTFILETMFFAPAMFHLSVRMNIVMIVLGKLCGKRRGVSTDRLLLGMTSGLATGQS